MTMLIAVDTSSPVPPYEQVRAQLAHLIRVGKLAAEQRLPPVRQLAADLGLAVGTVARAYRELETAGLVASRRGAGTRVTDNPDRQAESERAGLLVEQARAYLLYARQLGASTAEAHAALETAAQLHDHEHPP